ncbi:hypothetical protein SHIRM173S_03988 [Streptomyces hirsutus]
MTEDEFDAFYAAAFPRLTGQLFAFTGIWARPRTWSRKRSCGPGTGATSFRPTGLPRRGCARSPCVSRSAAGAARDAGWSWCAIPRCRKRPPVPVPNAPRYQGGTKPVQIVFGVLVLGATWSAGTAVRERRESLRRALTHAAEQAKAEERLRIARDIHDVVTHSVGLIAVKAGVANHVIATRPEEAREALEVIEDVSRRALRGRPGHPSRYCAGTTRATDGTSDRCSG